MEYYMANLPTENISKANGAAHDFKSKVMTAENQLETMTKNAGERVGQMASEFATATSDYVKTGRDYVQDNPVKGVAIAAAAGAVVGCILTLALRSSRQ
jgi:ElaB/YqjD/DUF883 family membrane-anchored ribosome-binding protein